MDIGRWRNIESMKKKVAITQSENWEVVNPSFTHSLNTYLLSTCSVQGILLDTRDAVKKQGSLCS